MSELGLLNAVVLILPALIGLFLGVYSWRRRTLPGASSFAVMMFVAAGWCFTAAMIVLSSDPTAARFWLNAMLAIAPFTPVCVLATVAHTTRNPGLVRRPRLIFWLLIPTITAVLSLTSTYHDWYISNVQFVQSGAQNIAWTNHYGVWTAIHLSYSYTLIVYSFVLLTQQYARLRFRTYRLRILLLVVSLLLPSVTTAYNTIVLGVHYFTPPIMFNFSAPALFWVLFRYRLFELTPIARDQAFEHMDDAVIIVDEENRVVDVNPSAARLAQQDSATLIGKSLLDVYPALLPATLDSASRQTIPIGEDSRYFDLHVTPIARQQQQVGKLIVLRNVTEQRLAEARARRMEMERQRVQTLADFIEGASHEFRTPLTVIKNAAFIVNRTDDADKRAEKAAQIDEQADLLTQLVDDLLTVVRLNDQLELTFHALDVNALMRAVEQKLRPDVEAKSLRLQLRPAPDLPPIRGNSIYLQEAIYAVLHNAVRYTPAGGCITLSTVRQGDQVLLSVQDTGIGIAPEHLPHIFDVFFRVDKARSTAGFGTGLAIASRIIALHGGSITASSEVNVGTTVQMTFPLLNSLGMAGR